MTAAQEVADLNAELAEDGEWIEIHRLIGTQQIPVKVKCLAFVRPVGAEALTAGVKQDTSDVVISPSEIIARLVDGRVISVSLAWSWRLSEATPKQRSNFRLIGSGQGVHWPDVDEDISVEGMLHGVPAHRLRSRPGGTDAGGGGDHELPNKRIQPTARRARRG